MSATKESNEDLQWSLIGSLLVNPNACRDTRECIKHLGMKSEYMTVPELRALYGVLVDAPSDDPAILRDLVIRKSSVDVYMKAVDRGCEIYTDIEYAVRSVKNAGLAQTASQITMQIVGELSGGKATGEYAVSELKRRFDGLYEEVFRQAQTDAGFSLRDIGNPIPEEEDPNCLFKGHFLEKGGALVLASVSGSGKSVISLQLAFSWAVGKSIFGITPMHPFRIGIFQTEDSKQDIARFGHDIAEGYRRQGWKDEEVDKAVENIRFFDVDGKMDDEFLNYLSMVQAREKFDLVIINPLTGITCIDISNNTEMNELLCKKLDPIIKHNADAKCGLMIVHHTNKPPAANQRTNIAQDRYAQYIGAGAAKLTNWMRAMLAIMPTVNPGEYYFVAAKRGECLGWPALPGKPTANPTRLLRHATREEKIMFWYEVNTGDLAAATAGAKTGGDPEEPCVTKDAALLAGNFQKTACTLTEARKFAKTFFEGRHGKNRGEDAYNEMMHNLSDYNVVVKPTGIGNKWLIGSEESVEKLFSTLQEKEVEKLRAKLEKKKAEK